MYKIICKDLGFDCNFTMKNNDRETLATNFGDHLQVDHKQFYPKKDVFDFIDNQNSKQNNLESIKNKKLSCVDSCESFRLEKWQIGHRNFP
ncbi:DUF1059 domain-containing protein [Nitrosarchaeum koreense]|uniref:DUF1059 domain containing protein n=1 Tax=Nitrosarchaeum koreense MY1 TaxID=1001994 RepID=F9CW25_9ARCH|nr:DUF1059 domain-containing protein [Nitrosarchaeum koreense]EGP93477.1 hypothetical protein MY1_0714 [Nitrosarchaeum koreense MY1]